MKKYRQSTSDVQLPWWPCVELHPDVCRNTKAMFGEGGTLNMEHSSKVSFKLFINFRGQSSQGSVSSVPVVPEV